MSKWRRSRRARSPQAAHSGQARARSSVWVSKPGVLNEPCCGTPKAKQWAAHIPKCQVVLLVFYSAGIAPRGMRVFDDKKTSKNRLKLGEIFLARALTNLGKWDTLVLHERAFGEWSSYTAPGIHGTLPHRPEHTAYRPRAVYRHTLMGASHLPYAGARLTLRRISPAGRGVRAARPR